MVRSFYLKTAHTAHGSVNGELKRQTLGLKISRFARDVISVSHSRGEVEVAPAEPRLGPLGALAGAHCGKKVRKLLLFPHVIKNVRFPLSHSLAGW